jgi:hypothetical protein
VIDAPKQPVEILKMTKTKKVVAYKAFNADMSCRGFKYEVGQTYEHDGTVEMCGNGFHACTVPFDCWTYYEGSTNLARVVYPDGVLNKQSKDSKVVGAKIIIEAKLELSDWIKAQTKAVLALCKSAKGALVSKQEECAAATGYSGHAAATGDRGHAAATGDRGHAAATGYSGHAAATGKNAIAASLGRSGTAKVGPDGWLVLAACGDWNGNEYPPLLVKAAKVGGPEGVKANATYRLTADGEFVEV